MRIILAVLAILTLVGGFICLATATTVIHEIYGGIMLTISAVLISGAAILEELIRIRRVQEGIWNRSNATHQAPRP